MRLSRAVLAPGLLLLLANSALALQVTLPIALRSPLTNASGTLASRSAQAANNNPDLSQAERLIREGKYQEAYDMLSPLEQSMSNNATFTYLFGRAALGTNHPDKARTLFERSLELRPDDVAAHLALGRALFALEYFAEAKIEFETVLRFEYLPSDLLTQVEIYDEAAEQYLEKGRQLVSFTYLEGGGGYYWDNTVSDPTEDRDEGRGDPFVNARLGGSMDYIFPSGYTLNASIDYRFRHYDNPDSRNDSDWRWAGSISRTTGDVNLALGARGRISYVGNGTYRNDYGAFGNVRYTIDPSNQLTFEVDVQRRSYPTALRNRGRDIGDGSLEWNHSLAEGRASFSVGGNAGYEWATHNRLDGNAAVFGANGSLNFVVIKRVDISLNSTYTHRAFDEEREDISAALYAALPFTRSDHGYTLSATPVWAIGRGWSLRPEVFYERIQSSIPANNYHSIQTRVNLRKDF